MLSASFVPGVVFPFFGPLGTLVLLWLFLVCLVHVGDILDLLHFLVLVPSLLLLPTVSFPFYFSCHAGTSSSVSRCFW